MSTGANCVFTENSDGTWNYKIQRYPYGEWPEYDEHGPFGTKDAAVAHLNANYANPGGWSVNWHPDQCRHETVRDGRCLRCRKEMGRTGFTVTGGGPLRRSCREARGVSRNGDTGYRYLKMWNKDFGLPTSAERDSWKHSPQGLLKVVIVGEDDEYFHAQTKSYRKHPTWEERTFYYEVTPSKFSPLF